MVSIRWTEKNHAEMAITWPRANKTISALLLGLYLLNEAGDFVLIYLLNILQMFEHLRLMVRGGVQGIANNGRRRV
jgi:hypothetical protein